MKDLTSLHKEGHIAVLKLERPEAMNAISGAMADEITTRTHYIAEDPDVWAVVVTAAGDRAFCVGADLKERATFTLDDFYENRTQIRAMFESVRKIPQPTIAAVFGYALGGGLELALSCDLIVAEEGTQLGLPEARVGLLPAGGGTQLLARKAGVTRAKEMIFTGKRIDAVEAHEWGLVTRVVGRGGVPAAAGELALDVCRASPVAVRAAKKAIDSALGVALEEGIEVEHEGWEKVIASDDRLEGIKAFNEKRAPHWQNS